MIEAKERCPWCGDDPLYVDYHDNEWGVPVHDDRILFEFLVLEGAQAGLSWSTILRRREGYRAVFSGFDPATVAEHALRTGVERHDRPPAGLGQRVVSRIRLSSQLQGDLRHPTQRPSGRPSSTLSSTGRRGPGARAGTQSRTRPRSGA